MVNDQGTTAGVALVPGTCGDLLTTNTCASLTTAGIQRSTSSAVLGSVALVRLSDRCRSSGLCCRGGAVMHTQRDVRAHLGSAPPLLADDPGLRRAVPSRRRRRQRHAHLAVRGHESVRGRRQRSSSSGAGANPAGPNPTGQARNASVYGGGCVDFGTVGGFSCKFGDTNGTGHGYPNGNDGSCSVSGSLCVTGCKTSRPK